MRWWDPQEPRRGAHRAIFPGSIPDFSRRVRRGQPRDISSRSGQAGNQSRTDRIPRWGHDDWYFTRCTLRGQNGGCFGSNDNVDLETHEVRRQLGQLAQISLSGTEFNLNVSSIDIAKVAETFRK